MDNNTSAVATWYNMNTCERVEITYAPECTYNVYDGRKGGGVHHFVLGHVVSDLKDRLEQTGFVRI